MMVAPDRLTCDLIAHERPASSVALLFDATRYHAVDIAGDAAGGQCAPELQIGVEL
jgi:hypothetical protein